MTLANWLLEERGRAKYNSLLRGDDGEVKQRFKGRGEGG